jgi:hypothetical protein
MNKSWNADLSVFDTLQRNQNVVFDLIDNGVLSDALSRGLSRRDNLKTRNENDDIEDDDIDNGSGGIAHLTRKANAAETKYHDKAKAYYTGTGSKEAAVSALKTVSQIDKRLSKKK